MVRNEMQAKYGDSIYTAGYKCLPPSIRACRRRPRWRCAPACWNTIAATAGAAQQPRWICRKSPSARIWTAELEEFPIIGGLRPAIVEKVEGKSAKIYVKELGTVNLPWEKMSWARRELPDEKTDRAPTRAVGNLQPRRCDLHGGQSRRIAAIRADTGGAKCSGVRGSEGRRRGRAGRRLRLSSRASTIGSRKRGASSVRHSSPSSTRRLSTRAIRRPASFWTRPSSSTRPGTEQAWRPKEDAEQFGPDSPARGDGAFAQFGVGASDARDRRSNTPGTM